MTKSSKIDVVLGQNLRRLRELKGLSQTTLSRFLTPPVTFQQLQKYESGKNRISVATLLNISDILKCSMDDLMAGAYYNKSSTLWDYDMKFLQAYHSIKDEKFKQHIRKLVLEMAK